MRINIRYECLVQAGPFNMIVKVVTKDSKRVNELVKAQVAAHMKKYHGLPLSLIPMQIISCIGQGEVLTEEDPAGCKFLQAAGRGQ